MRILLTTYYDPNYIGVRLLASTLLHAGHEVCIGQFKDLVYKPYPLVDEYDKDYNGYLLYTRHGLSFASSPITDIEIELFESAIKQWQPDVVGISIRSPFNHLLDKIIPSVRRAMPTAFVACGGYGPTYQPEIPLSLGVDAVIRGEGEGALLELASALSAGREWRGIENLSIIKEDTIQHNPLRPLITDLDNQPFALYYGDHFFSIEDNTLLWSDLKNRSKGGNYFSEYCILTARGCVAHCSYCAAGNWRAQYKKQGLKAPPIRPRSLDNVLKELMLAKEHGEKFITFNDEYFIRPTKDLLDFLTRYEQEVDLPFFAHFSHAQLLRHPELVDAAMSAGAIALSIGLQSASEKFAAEIYNRKTNNDEVLEAINLFTSKGFLGNYHIIGGNPLETDSEIEMLFDFAARVPFDPSLNTNFTIHSTALRLLEGAPLAHQHPELKEMKISPKDFARNIMLADLRNMVDNNVFSKIRNDPFFIEHPEKLLSLIHSVIRDRHHQYLMKQISRIEGHNVYFWGCGEMYKYKHHLFGKVNPICILVDKGTPPTQVDGIPVHHPDKILPFGDNAPIIVFSSQPNLVSRTIRKKYPSFRDVIYVALL